jgi:hypothetical protein
MWLVVTKVLEEGFNYLEYSALRMEVACFAETLGPTFQTTTWCCNRDVTIGIVTAMNTSVLTNTHTYYNMFLSDVAACSVLCFRLKS